MGEAVWFRESRWRWRPWSWRLPQNHNECDGAELGQGLKGEFPGWSQAGHCLGSLQVSSREPVCRSCLKKTLHKLEAMMRVLQAETTAGTGTPTAIADSILNITGMG